MTAVSLLVKSHKADLEYARRLMDSIGRHNVDGLPVFVVVPPSDVDDFRRISQGVAEVLPETLLAEHLVSEPTAGFSAGYINQEIVKLAFWKLGTSGNYFCVDSDAQFVRDFASGDFMADDATPFTILTEDKDLQVDPFYFNRIWQGRAKALSVIAQEVGYTGLWPVTVHGHAIFSATVLKSFEEEFLAPRGWDYVDALRLAPYEPSWYNAWLLHRRPIPLIRREPLVKTFHTPVDHLDYALRGLSARDVARGFLAVVVNSNFTRSEGVLSMGDPLEDVLASHVSTGDLIGSLAGKLTPWRRSSISAGD